MIKIKLPNTKKGISPDSLWKTIIAISETGTTFTTVQLSQAPNSPTKNVDSLSRVLSYLKFMGVITENRSKDDEQKFTIQDDKKIDDLIYSLKARRQDDAYKGWLDVIAEHPMFTYILEKFFERFNTRTFIDLEHFLKKEIPNKEPNYYQEGGRFIMTMLQNCGKVIINNNNITKVRSEESEPLAANSLEENQEEIETEIFEEKESKSEAIIANSNSFRIKDEYHISIKTPNIKFESKIENSLQLGIVETILQTIKVELSSYNE